VRFGIKLQTVAVALCSTCYTLRRQKYISVAYGSRSSSEMAIAVVFAELRGDANAPSSFIIAYQENPFFIL
jgi:hypothetical protein